MRTRAERRKTDFAQARKKQNIAENVYSLFRWYDNLHQYSKNKIHCSCPLCRSKTRHTGTIGPEENWPVRDKRQQEDAVFQMNDLLDDE